MNANDSSFAASRQPLAVNFYNDDFIKLDLS